MTLAATLVRARFANDWSVLVQAMPFARFLDLRVAVERDEFVCTLPFDPQLIGNPRLPALHGGATGGFLECAGLLYIAWARGGASWATTIDLHVDYLRSGQPRDTHAGVVVVKQGRRLVNLRVEAWQTHRDEPIALAQLHFHLNE
ncbi:PaaI family thioesterase [Aquabacterium sp. J223]|uniref:PaaI family thioesterase n=1 Tax=Aquabacterium sp. J223 TaxID=2898431 RepID=UPI0021ADF519|nr:PaaI family thioesterase [Aquabacterium sp. J223]UUX97366.1 PaaI family thioesterase [Aquabacterium sp. J223]